MHGRNTRSDNRDKMTKVHSGPFPRLLKTLVKIEANEINATLASFFLVLIIMASYYILRPVRDAMSSDWSDATVSLLWTFNFFFTFAVITLYGFVTSRFSIKHLIPSVYGFFAATFIIFYLFSQNTQDTAFLDKAFYIWVSVFSLFPLSLFWSFMADIYTKEQSKRLFGIITTGASLGAIAGPSIPLLFSSIGTYNLMLLASTLLLLTLPMIYLLQGLKLQDLNNEENIGKIQKIQSLGGNPLAGFKLLFQNRLLLGISIFLFLYTGIGSFVYLELKNLMVEYSRVERTEIWAFIDLATNTLTVVAGLFITSRLSTKLGLGWTLALIPIIVMGGLLSVAMVPLLTIVVTLQIFRRGGNYGITRPAREMLFTYVDQESRFKAKPIIDVIVYRGGDVFWGWSFTSLTQIIGLGMAGVAAVGATIAGLWAIVGYYIGRSVEGNPDIIDDRDSSTK